MKLLPFAALCFLLGAAGGWRTGRAPSATPSASEEPRLSPRQSRARQRAQGAIVPAEVAARLSPVHAAKTPAERLRATIHLARTIPVSELARWYEKHWFDVRNDADAEIFAGITRDRWMDEDPEGLLDHVRLRKWPNLNEVAERWARLDPARAIAYLESTSSTQDKSRLKLAMLGGLAKSRPDYVLAAASEGPQNENQNSQWNEIFKELARHHPSTLEMAEFPRGLQPNLRESLRRALLIVSFERDSEAALVRQIASPEGAQPLANAVVRADAEFAAKVSSGLLARLASLPPEFLDAMSQAAWKLARHHPAAWLEADLSALGVAPEAIARLHESALESLVDTHPEDVLHHLDRHDFKGQDSISFIAAALRRLKDTDPAKAAEWQARPIAEAPDEDFATRLTARLELRPFPQPNSAQAILASFDMETDPTRPWELTLAIGSAPPAARREFEEHLKSMDSADVAVLAHKLNTQHLQPALEAPLLTASLLHPQENPEAGGRHNPETAAVSLATKWIYEDPTAASRWAASLPAGEARSSVLRILAANWAPYDTPAANAWIAKLPAADQVDIRDFLKNGPPQ